MAREDSTSCSENICYFEESGLLGRVQELRDRTACLMCIPVSEIECTIGIIANMFTNKEYILDRNLIRTETNRLICFDGLALVNCLVFGLAFC
ncbi:hypothetical protein V1519DRAFT_457262 [Lipomyces tetrasporus]